MNSISTSPKPLAAQKRSKIHQSLAIRLSVVAVLMVLLCFVATSVLVYFTYRGSSIDYHAEKASNTAVAIASFIDSELLAASMQSETEDAYWQLIQARLNDTLIGIPDVIFAYIMWPYNDTQFQYFASGYRPGGAPYVGFRDVEDPEVYSDIVWEAIRFGTVATTGIEYAGIYGYLVSGFAPIFDSAGNVLALVGVDFEASRVDEQTFHFIRNIVLIGILVMLIASVLFTRYVSKLVSKPLAPLVNFLERAAVTGDFVFNQTELETINKYKHDKDEIGMLASSVVGIMDEILHEMKTLENVADGDISFTPNILSESDRLGLSLTKVVDSLNSVFAEIKDTTTQVSAGSEQIANGAQILAQGATEQAATVEELSASTSEVSEKIKANAAMTIKAAELASAIKNNAETGSRQMNEMVAAVNEISQASQSIGQVIKVIDDIAFQTNILALNAAVEAARAGQHGKGFAVVADEVRTLAAKSAEAAKNTGALISNSIEKAEYGARIAQDTAESLGEIVNGINESSDIIAKIAHASEAQSGDIAQINTSIDQVASVVQQNSATAEESAAAAEELSSQSAMLDVLVSRFKLKSTAMGRHSMSGL